jgi:hypothetical protein
VPTEGWSFCRTFTLLLGAYDISGWIQITVDNAYGLSVNGTYIGGDGALDKKGPDSQQWSGVEIYSLTNLQPGENTILIGALNYFKVLPGPPYPEGYSPGYDYDDPTKNPAGLIFKFVITYEDGPIKVSIDIKPVSWPNAINPGSNGLVPVAILSSEDFDATTVDSTTVTLAGATVAIRRKGKAMAQEADVNGDGLVDLVVQVETQGEDAVWESGIVELTGTTIDGLTIVGYDEIIIAPTE